MTLVFLQKHSFNFFRRLKIEAGLHLPETWSRPPGHRPDHMRLIAGHLTKLSANILAGSRIDRWVWRPQGFRSVATCRPPRRFSNHRPASSARLTHHRAHARPSARFCRRLTALYFSPSRQTEGAVCERKHPALGLPPRSRRPGWLACCTPHPIRTKRSEKSAARLELDRAACL